MLKRINFKKIITYRFGNNVKKGFTPLNPAKREFRQRRNYLTGFTLLEVIFAIFVILVGVIGAYTVIQKAISHTYQSSLQLTAAYLAQEGIEIVRNIRDANWVQGETNWNDGLAGVVSEDWEADYTTTTFKGTVYDDCGVASGYNCHSYSASNYLKISNGGFYCYNGGDETPFTRKITITPDGDKLNVSVEVEWEYKGDAYGPVTVQEILYKWYY